MAQRRHHYEQAFEHYLRARRVPYVAVDEARRTLLPASAAQPAQALKSFDFVVYGRRDNLLLDIKGRKIARRSGSGAWSALQNWVTLDDIDSLRAWRTLFGEGFEACFVFVYWCDEQPPDGLFHEVFTHRDRWYSVRCVSLPEYEANMRPRSPRWGTVHLGASAFQRVSTPFCPAGTDTAPHANHALHPLDSLVP
ncbi:MAG: HYExAFE family protein [Phycisphaeraceae bacterium]|nr:HYExAFE family protein [Phycisphaeraceae bacterium]